MKKNKLRVLISTAIASFLEIELENKNISEKTIDIISEKLDNKSLSRIEKFLERGTNVRLKGDFSEILLRSPSDKKKTVEVYQTRKNLEPIASATFEVTLNDLLDETAKSFI